MTFDSLDIRPTHDPLNLWLNFKIMPYTFLNINYAKTLAGANWYSRENLENFILTLNNGNITVVEALREMKTGYNNLQKTAIKGTQLFKTNKRWPQSDDLLDDTIYYTTADSRLNRVMLLIASALDDRVISNTREQANAVATTQRAGNAAQVGEDNGRDQQNAFKQLSELRITLSSMMNDETLQWDRARAEVRMSANWNDHQQA